MVQDKHDNKKTNEIFYLHMKHMYCNKYVQMHKLKL